MSERTALFVLGMHRSGTSALTRVLGLLGASLPLHLYPPGPGNETGHWEPEAAVRLHDEILDAAETWVNDVCGPSEAWFQTPAAQVFVEPMKALLADEFGEASLLVFKDPRSALVFPLWRAALEQMNIGCRAVVLSRNPVEVAHSLAKRQFMAVQEQSWPLDRGGLLWLRYMLAAERHSRGIKRSFCLYSQLLDDWRAVVGRLGRELEVSWPRSIPGAERDIDEFLQPSHRHYHEPDDLGFRAGVWSSWIAPTFLELRRATQGSEPDPTVFDTVARSFEAVCDSLKDTVPEPSAAGAAPQPPCIRIMRSRGDSRKTLCLVGRRFWRSDQAGDGHVGAVEAAIAAGVDVAIADHGPFDPPAVEAFEDFARRYALDVECLGFDGPEITPPHLEPTIRLFRYARAQNFNAVLFQDSGGLGYASVVAKQTGLAFERTALGIVADGSSGRARAQKREFPVDLVTIGVEYLERRAVELANLVVCSEPGIALWMQKEGWRIASLLSLEPDRGGAIAAADGWATILQRLLAVESAPQSLLAARADTTVVITHFEQPRLLDQNLQALTRQTDPDFAVVIVDDGSGSVEAKQYLDTVQERYPSLKLSLVRQDNRYLGAARNAGIRAADTEFVILLDDDNVAFPDMVRTLRRAIVLSTADVITCGIRHFHDETDTPGSDSHPEGPEQFFAGGPILLGATHNCFGDASAIYRKSLFEKIGGFHELYGVTFEDWQLYLRAVSAGQQLLSLPEPLVWYRIRQNSMLRTTEQYDNAQVIRSVVEGLPGSALAPLSDYLIGTEMQQARLNREIERLEIRNTLERQVARVMRLAQAVHRPERHPDGIVQETAGMAGPVEAAPTLPRRLDHLQINTTADGYVIYDHGRDRVHYLNASSSVIFELCDGESSASEIAEGVREAFDLAGPPDAEVAACLEKLVSEGLIVA